MLDFLAEVSACVSPLAISAIHKFLSNAFSSQLVFCTSYTTLFPSGEILGLDALCHSSDWSIVGTVDAGVGAVLAASCATAEAANTPLHAIAKRIKDTFRIASAPVPSKKLFQDSRFQIRNPMRRIAPTMANPR